MAPKINQGTGPVGSKDVGLEARAAVRAEWTTNLLKQLGLPNRDALSGFGGALEAFEKALEGADVGKTFDARAAAAGVKQAFARDFAVSFDPGPHPSESVKIAGNVDATRSRKDGGFELVGAPRSKDHPLSLLLMRLEIDPGSFGPHVKAVLDKTRGKDIAHAGSWTKLAQDLAQAKVADAPLGGVGKLAGASAAQTAAKVAETAAAGAGLGLSKTARTEKEIAGGEKNMESVRAAATKDTALEERRGVAVKELSALFASAGLSPEQVSELGPVLDKVLREGQRGVKDPTERAWAIIKSANKELNGASMPNQSVRTGDGPLAAATSLAAGAQLFMLAEGKTGAAMAWEKAPDAQKIIMDYVGASGVASPASKSSASAAPAAKKTGLNLPSTKAPAAGAAGASKVAPEVKAQAEKAAKAIGLDPTAASAAHTMKAIEGAFSEVIGKGKSDKDQALAALRWVEKQVGEQAGSLSGHAKNILGVSDSPDVTAMMKGWAFQQLALCAGAGPEGYLKLRGTQAAAGGGMPPLVPPGGGGVAGGGGGGPPFIPPFGGGVPGFGGFVPGGLETMAINPGSPLGMGHRMQGMQRSMMVSAILHDPALSMEDKITLFLMMLCAFFDHDRRMKMGELADLDRAEAMKKQAATGPAAGATVPGKTATPAAKTNGTTTTPKPAATTATGATATGANGVTGANGATGATGATPKPATTTATGTSGTTPKPPATNGATTATNGTPATPNANPIANAAANLAQGTLPGGAQPGGVDQPKSRDLMMMELDRIGKLRDMIFEMVKSFLDQSNRNTKDIWRGT